MRDYARRGFQRDPWGEPSPTQQARFADSVTAWRARYSALARRASPRDTGATAALANARLTLSATASELDCRSPLWNVDQLNGLQSRLAFGLNSTPLGAPSARDSFIVSMARFPAATRRLLANLASGLAQGYSAPQQVTQRVIQQLDGLLANDGAALTGPLTRDTSADLRARWEPIVRDSIVPWLQRYRTFLHDDYLPHARAEPGLAALPHGAACYRGRLLQATGTRASPDSLYALAVRQRLALGSGILAAGRALLGDTVDLISSLRRVRADPAFVMTDADSIVAAYTRGVERARASLPQQFSFVPEAPLVVEAIPRAQAASAPPAQYAGTLGSGPAIFQVNAYQPGGIATMNVVLGVAHEGYPGHHFQFIYSAARHAPSTGAPLGNGAYVEGWGIYAERLASEAGLYDTPLSRLGYLVHQFDVFMALQVDIGMHARNWTRAQAVDTMMQVAGRPSAQAASYADRHATTPAQLATYGIGYLAILGARERARHALGDRFDPRAFHDVILSDGDVSLEEMDRRVDRWIKSR